MMARNSAVPKPVAKTTDREMPPKRGSEVAKARNAKKLQLVPQQLLSSATAWSEEEKAIFLKTLEQTFNVSAASRVIGKKAAAAYRLRDKDNAFAAAWKEASDSAINAMEEAVIKRAVKGVKRKKYYGGKLIGTETHYSDQLAIFLLKTLRPEIYGRADPVAEENATDESVARMLEEKFIALRKRTAVADAAAHA
jgi:hypothetical protein